MIAISPTRTAKKKNQYLQNDIVRLANGDRSGFMGSCATIKMIITLWVFPFRSGFPLIHGKRSNP